MSRGVRLPVVLGVIAAVTACSPGRSTAAPRTAAPAATTPVADVAGCDDANIGENTTRSDLDGDSETDIAVGIPSYARNAGAVDVRGSNSKPLLLRAADLGGSPQQGAGFGSAIAMGDLDDDHCADLVIGAPGEGSGQVYVVFGGPGGLDLKNAFRLPDRPGTRSEFGRALAMYSRGSEQFARGDNDLFVGAPGATVDGKVRAGQVWHYRITAGGPGRVTATLQEVISQDSAGAQGAAEAGDRFGEVLAPQDQRGVVVGVPGEDVGRARDAGAIWFLPIGPAGSVRGAREWSQESAKVSGKVLTGNRFGAAVGSRGVTVVVGAPGADIGSARDAGLVQVFERRGDTLAPGRVLTQNSRGVADVAEAGDRFGAAVVVGVSISGHGTGTVDAAIGAPGEDIGGQADAGMIALVPVRGTARRPVVWLRQGRDLRGTPEAGDALGSVLTVTRGGLYADEDYADHLWTGVPGEDLGARADAGVVQQVLWRGKGPANLTFPGRDGNARGYGQVLPSSSD